MPRILPPPTKYDPLRLVQAKAAGPAAPGVAIPPTRFDPGVLHRAMVIQRAAAAASPAAAAAAAGGGAANSNDTPAVTYARGLSQAEREHCLKQDAVIGSDQPGKSEVLIHLQKQAADCLAVWLVEKHGGAYGKGLNIDWLNACSRKVKILNVSVISEIKSGVIKATNPKVIRANKRKYLTTGDEAAILLFRGFVLAGDTLCPPGAVATAKK
ncbi:hypothetical protein Q9Q95_19670 [Sphingomonas sp. DG1-23]|uniref:hypothetical protein n=1 Tax=Sphingomonas sp. DG1-23 TaxID=3068316 RepID=UPI00273E3666|nr:hypothetical protein [Sphingomonas sp. DG1-23]MDP5281153.1 hypothetical protein [Sphingomonas sp. DG1-23]